MPKVSVIVAIYKVEAYIERCLHSLFSQTIDDIEFVFVDDASPDNSMAILNKILKQYPSRKNQVKIIRHVKNQGVGKARKVGILSATGEYIIHCDPDDFVEVTMYEEMYQKAKESVVDIVVCNYTINFKKNRELINNGKIINPSKCLENFYKKDGISGFLWDKLVKKRL